MFLTSYDTTATRKYVTANIARALQVAKINGELQKADIPDYPAIYVVVGKTPATEQIPNFTQPLVVGAGKDRFVAIDLRAYSNKALVDGVLQLPTTGNIGLLVKQALLQTIWLEGMQYEMFTLSDLPIKTYSSWMSEGIGKQLNVDPVTQMEIQAACAWFYACSFMRPEEYTIDAALPKSVVIARITKIPNERVLQIIEACGYLNNASEFVDRTKTVIDSPRYQQLTTPLLYQLLAGSWFGSPSARETVAVAIEFPPTFLALAHTACTERGYRDSKLAKVMARLDKNGAFNQFNAAFHQLVYSS